MAGRKSTFIDLAGKRFGMLRVIGASKVDPRGKTFWLCKCDCGKSKVARGDQLTGGITSHCGCQEHTNRSAGAFAAKAFTHHEGGMKYRTKEYRVWYHLIARCTNPRESRWKDYGGRGITVSQRWIDSYPQFLADVGRAPSPKHSLDRFPDNDGNYEPGNVRWATHKQQMQNTRRNRWITFEGLTLIVSDWEKRLGLPVDAIAQRLRAGWTERRALTTPFKKRR